MDPDRIEELFSCSVGDIVECTDGREYEMIKINRVRFLARDIEDGVVYRIPFEMFLKVVSRKVIDFDKIGSLKPGDLFLINDRRGAILFKFEKFEKGNIIGVNPLTGTKGMIAKSIFACKVDEL